MLNLLPKPAETGTADSFAEEGFWPGRESAPRAGLYARVSTPDQQTLPMQLAAMRDYARKREIDSVALWRLDCWGRLWFIWSTRFRSCRPTKPAS